MIFLVQPEAYFHVDLYGDGFAVFHGRLELPGLDRLNGFLVESQAKAARHAKVTRPAVRTNHQPQNAGSLIFRLACFFRILRIGLINHSRRAHSATYPEHSAAHTAAAALTHTGPGAHTDAAAGT